MGGLDGSCADGLRRVQAACGDAAIVSSCRFHEIVARLSH